MVALLEAQAYEIRALQRAVRELEGRLEVLVAVDAMLADQLRTPLGVVGRALEELRGVAEGPRGEGLVDEALVQLMAVKAVVGELIEPQKIGPAPVERARLVRVPLDGLVEQALTIVAPVLDRDRVAVDLPAGFMVSTAPRRLVGILVNLFENAATHGGDTPVECRGEAFDTSLRIEVADHGPGLGGAEVESLFQPAPAADGEDAEPGKTGLYLVRMLARSLDGDATVSEGPDGGTVARVDLPQRRDEDRRQSDPRHSARFNQS